MNRLFATAAMVITWLAASAVPAQRGQWKTITLADGTQVKAELVGDEFMHYWQSEDGRKFIRISENRKERFLPADMEKMKASAEQHKQQRAAKASTRGIGDSNTYVGKRKGLVILVQFADLKFKSDHTNEFYQRVLNERNFQEGDYRGSVKDYFADQSGGQFELDFDVAGPYTLANPYAYYGQNVENIAGNDKNPGKMISEAVEKASADFEFSPYDWDGDYEVDQVFVLYAGQGEANGGNADTVWPHEWKLEYATGSAMSINNLRVDTYACSSELGASENINSGIGTICHEFSHCLGLPDMYDTGSESNNYGMGTWDVMCSGSYNGNGFCPANYTSFERSWCGWLTPVELKEDATISHMKSLSEGGGAYIIYNDNHKDEYYLLECRHQSGWDTSVAGNGLLVLHVDFDANVWRYNAVNAFKVYYDVVFHPYFNDHQRCTILAGDNALSRTNESGDPFPFNKRNYLSNVSSPAASLYNKNTDGSLLMNKAVRDIQRNDDGTVRFPFVAHDTQTEPVFEGILFDETFDACVGTGGNDNTWTGGSAEFTPDNQGWTYDTKNAVAGGAQKCAKFGTRATKGNVSMPKVFVGAESALTFKAAPWAEENTRISITILGSPDTTVSPTTFTLTPGQWTECSATIKGQGDITISLTPSNNRFFLDDVKVVAGNGSTDIRHTVTHPDTDNKVYCIDGRHIGNNPAQLGHGIYIINKKKVIK